MADSVSDKITIFFSSYRTRTYAKGQILLLNGDDADYIYHLVKGTVKQYDVTYRGEEIILNLFRPPAFFPMSLAINHTANPYIFEAETELELHRVPANDAVQFLRDNPDVAFDLLGRVYRGMDGILGRMAQLMAGNAQDRLLYELILEAKRFTDVNKKGDYSLKLTEKEIGARAGLSRETISRELNKLKTEGVLTVHSKEITIPNLSALERKLHLNG